MNFPTIGLQVPRVLLPEKGTDMQNWAVIACDQYTSDRDYWQRLADRVGDKPSTLQLIFPEVYLKDADAAQRIERINAAMERYLADGTLVEQTDGFVLVDRSTAVFPSRKGLIVALDLECYDYNRGATSLIRATEGTILDRLPPRIRVRRNASLELPHIMVLIDDPQRTVIEPLFGAELESLYDFDLMEGGGHIRGYRVSDPALIQQVVNALEKLADPAAYASAYPGHEGVMLYAMGDGNHSFATAKAIWQDLKANASDPVAILDHPARYALVELINVHDPGLEFEAIHRVLFDVDVDYLRQAMVDFFARQGTPCTIHRCGSEQEALDTMAVAGLGHRFACVLAGTFCCVEVAEPAMTLEVATLQAFLDHYLEESPWVGIDYIHGNDSVTRLGSHGKRAGFYLPSISKHDLFKTIVLDGALPRKTFSMGEADEKRFYLECRAIR
ncbi:MAG: DUF1015 domain-containing protein [Desulfuromonadaceae bacterium]|nr:DUF1015 domain-containing protein [Desulfuromonadaceae bacterium]